MEAAVLKPAVGTEMERSSSMTAELEVRKLQELVRELERQNQQLRSRAGGCCPGGPAGPPPSPGSRFPSPLPSLLGPTSSGSLSSAEEPLDCCHPQGAGTASEEEEDASEPSVLEELELLDLDSLSVKDESDETWLYVTSEAATDSLPPLQWCRQALDSPKSDVGAARRLASRRMEQDGDPGAADDAVDLGYKLQDLTDVQVMARLQEESLRQDYASTSSVLANSHSVSLQLCCIGAGLEEDVVERNCRRTLPCLRQSRHIRERQRSPSRCTRLYGPCTPGFLPAGSAFRGHPSVQQPAPGLGVPACGQTSDNLPGRGTTHLKTPTAHMLV